MPTNKKQIFFIVLIIAIVIIAKLFYQTATNNDLIFLLLPVTFIIEVFSLSNAVFSPQNGYFFANLNIIIDKSCAGFNFWIITFSVMAFLLIIKTKNVKMNFFYIIMAVFLSYGLTIFANSSRIFTLLFTDIYFKQFSNKIWFHEAVGVFVYLFVLISAYLFLDFILKKHYEKCS